MISCTHFGVLPALLTQRNRPAIAIERCYAAQPIGPIGTIGPITPIAPPPIRAQRSVRPAMRASHPHNLITL